MLPANELYDAIWDVADSGRYVLGDELFNFEMELAQYVGVDHCIGVGSGTDALTMALRCIDVTGKEVILPPLTFFASAEAVVHAGGIPVFADVDIQTWCLTKETVERQVTEQTAAIMCVDLFGNVCDYNLIETLDIPIVEDACQSMGSTYKGKMAGSFGSAAATSFYPSKNLRCMGDGGAVLTNDPEIAAHVRRLRNHGSDDRVIHTEIGYTSRLDELQAAVLRIGLQDFDQHVWDRKVLGNKHRRMFPSAQLPTLGADPAWHQYAYTTYDRSKISERQRIYYDPPLHQQPALAPYWREPLPTAEALSKLIVCTPF